MESKKIDREIFINQNVLLKLLMTIKVVKKGSVKKREKYQYIEKYFSAFCGQ
jgi:hypothetical protein